MDKLLSGEIHIFSHKSRHRGPGLTVLKPRVSNSWGVAQMHRPREREPEQMPRGCPGGMELTDAYVMTVASDCEHFCVLSTLSPL